MRRHRRWTRRRCRGAEAVAAEVLPLLLLLVVVLLLPMMPSVMLLLLLLLLPSSSRRAGETRAWRCHQRLAGGD